MLNALNASIAAYVVDGIALVVVLVCAVASARKGFVRCLFGLLSTIAALVVAFLLMKTVVSATDGLFGLQGVIETAATNGLSKLTGFDVDISSAGLEASLQGKLPSFLIALVAENFGSAELPLGTTAAMVVGETLGSLAVNLIAWLALFILTKLVLRVVRNIVSSIVEKLPIVGALNSLLGLAVGVLQGVLIVSAVLAIVALIPAESVVGFFNECIFVKYLYNHNPINVILGWLVV